MLREVVKYHDVTVLSSGGPDEAAAFARAFGGQCASAVFVPTPSTPQAKVAGKLRSALRGQSGLLNGAGRALTATIPDVLARTHADVVFLSTLLLDPSPVPDGKPVVGDTHNVEYDNLRRAARIARNPILRAYRGFDAELTRRTERVHGRRCKLVLATSDRDAVLLRALLGTVPVDVVPNGVDVNDVLPTSPRRPRSLLFAGMMSYAPNTHGVEWFLDRVFPDVRAALPDATFTVAGARPPRRILRRRDEGVHVTGFVPDMQTYFETSRATVVPVWAGGGTRVKILEAMAAGSVVVTTSLGCEGLHLRDGVDALVADTPREFARACIRVLSDAALADRLRRAAFERVRSTYRWSDIGHAVAALISRAAGAPTDDAASGPAAGGRGG
jgi:glycosyltransferase involved in cell wall biosynthesis